MTILLLADVTLIRESIFMDAHVSLQIALVAEGVATHSTGEGLLSIMDGPAMSSHRLHMVERLTTQVTQVLLQMVTGSVM